MKLGKSPGNISQTVWIEPQTLHRSFNSVPGWIKFDSIFEAEVYGTLKEAFPGRGIILQMGLNILPKVPCSRYKNPLNWRCDFALEPTKKQKVVFVEAKGNWIEHNNAAMQDFKKTLRLIDYFLPGLNESLVIVSPTAPIRFDEVHTSIPLKELVHKLTTLN